MGSFDLEDIDELNYAVMSALSFGLDMCPSRSHCPSDFVDR